MLERDILNHLLDTLKSSPIIKANYGMPDTACAYISRYHRFASITLYTKGYHGSVVQIECIADSDSISIQSLLLHGGIGQQVLVKWTSTGGIVKFYLHDPDYEEQIIKLLLILSPNV